LWVPPVARTYIPRNSLYPFKTYLGAGHLQSGLVSSLLVLALLFSFVDEDRKSF